MHYCFLSNLSIGHHLCVLTVDCETGQSLRHRVMKICNIELPFYSGWPEISNCTHELIRKVFRVLVGGLFLHTLPQVQEYFCNHNY